MANTYSTLFMLTSLVDTLPEFAWIGPQIIDVTENQYLPQNIMDRRSFVHLFGPTQKANGESSTRPGAGGVDIHDVI